MSLWKIIDRGFGTAQEIMNSDKELLEKIDGDSRPILHLYDWIRPSATYGYFTKPAELLNMEAVKKHQLELARRPTGGGIIFHLSDLAFSVLIPSTHQRFSLNTLDNYATINEAVIDAIKRFSGGRLKPGLYQNESMGKRQTGDHFCMAKPTQFDVMVDGYKVGGAAQRRTKKGFLHQGSISLALPPKDLLKAVLRPESNIFDAMQEVSYSLLEGEVSSKDLEKARLEMRQYLSESLLSGG